MNGIYDVFQDGRKYRFSADTDSITALMRFLLPFGIKSITIEPPSLEELFMYHYDNSIREKETQRNEI